jgi:hypothetical protein
VPESNNCLTAESVSSLLTNYRGSTSSRPDPQAAVAYENAQGQPAANSAIFNAI